MEKGGGPWTLGAIDFKPSLPKNSSSSIADFRYVFDIHTRVRSKFEFQIGHSNQSTTDQKYTFIFFPTSYQNYEQS